MKVIKLADFSKYLRCRDENQFDGRYSGKEFRNTYLRELNSPDWWRSVEKITIDFTEVHTITPSWANEVFAFFTKFASPCMIKNKIIFSNITRVKEATIQLEIKSGYRGSSPLKEHSLLEEL